VYALQQGLGKHHLKLVRTRDKRFNVKAQGSETILASLEPQPLNGMWRIRLPGSEETVVAEATTDGVADALVSLPRGASQ
jgi:hypothetical protein